MANFTVQRDVEASLMKIRKCRRKSGGVPYPLEYSNCILNFDNWDHMFLSSCCRSLTMHQFESPPPVVLDLGCGGGFWALEAAKHWTGSTIVGYDIEDIQPRLTAFPQHRDLARRIKWVHGNLLDGLPFPPYHFDFVRIVGLGLAVPEDEWQFVLEEVARVMKPGAVIEIIEEDLIFPCAPPPERIRPQPTLDVNIHSNSSIPSSRYSARTSSTLLSDNWTVDSGSESPAKTNHGYSSESILTPSISPQSSRSTRSIPKQQLHTPSITELDLPHPQNHTRLKAAWEAMLSRRFLATTLLAVLPFYLSSSFTDVQTHPALKIPLPPNSNTGNVSQRRRSDDSAISLDSMYPDVQFDINTSLSKGYFVDDEGATCCSINMEGSPYAKPSWASMHLAKTVRTVQGCKEAIFEEYEQLFAEDKRPMVTRSNRPDGAQSQLKKPSSREAFEIEWGNWENDMTDRIGMRESMAVLLAWDEPPGERPDWRVWRSNVDAKASVASSSSTNSSESSAVDLCRSLRGFVAWKP